MSTTVTVSGVSYSVPSEGESSWATDVTNLLIKLSTSTAVLQSTSTTFTLASGDLDFGATYGLKSGYYKSRAANPASAGVVRLGNAESIKWRNAANNADLDITVNASNALQFNGGSILSAGAASIVNADVNASAAIAYSKLNLSASIVNADVSGSAAIAYSKLNLATSIVNADINASAAIAYSKLNLSTSILNADISGSAAIAYSKLNLTGAVLNADLAGSIALSKLAALGTAKALQSNSSTGAIEVSSVTNTELGYLSGVTSAVQTQLDAKVLKSTYSAKGSILAATAASTPADLPTGTFGQVLTADSTASTGLKWASPATGLKNYVTFGSFENNSTTGWSATGCATVTNGLPVSVGTGAAAFSSSNGGQTKGANTNAPAIDSTSALSGTYSLNLATTGAGVIGDGYISQSYTIDKSDQSKVLSYKFSYKVASGTPALPGTSANTYAVAIYDIVNNAWLGVAGNFNIVQSSGTGIAQGSFQTASNTTGIQIFIYSPVAPTVTSSFLIDDVFIGPQSLAFGPAVSDWVAYTPTFVGWGTPTSVAFSSRRVGDTLEILGQFTSGTTTAVKAQVSLGYNGSNLSVTSAPLGKIPAAVNCVGTFVQGSTNPYGVTLIEPSTQYLTFGYQAAGANAGLTEINGNGFGASVIFSIYAVVPISGWSSNTVMSNDSDTRVVAAQYYVSANYAVTANQAINFDTKVIDTHSAVTTGAANAWRFTTPVSGTYSITVSQLSISGGSTPSVYKNGSAFVKLGTASSTSGTTTGTLLSLVAGDYISYNAQSTETVAGGALTSGTYIISINRLSGPAVVAQSESVNAAYSASGAISWTATGGANFDTKIYDTHNAVTIGANAWVFVCPMSGKFQFSLTATASTATNAVALYKNSSLYKYLFRFVSAAGNIQSSSADVSCVAGDTLSVRLDAGTLTGDASANGNNIYVKRVGN